MQSQLRTSFVVLITASLSAAQADAACTLNMAPGTKLRVPLVRVYSECSAATTYTPRGYPACVPAGQLDAHCSSSSDKCSSNADCLPNACYNDFNNGCLSQQDCLGESRCLPTFYPNTCDAPSPTGYRYGPKGSCTLSARSKVEKDCGLVTDSYGTVLGLPPGPCHVTYASLKCKGILGQDGSPAAFGEYWSLDMRVRVTLEDNGSALTQVDLPFSLETHHGDNELSLSANTAEILSSLMFLSNAAALPPCTQLQFTDVWLKDPSGNLFATVGMGTVAR